MCSGVGIQALEKFSMPYHKTVISVTSLIITVFSPDFVGKYFNKKRINKVNSGHKHRTSKNAPVP